MLCLVNFNPSEYPGKSRKVSGNLLWDSEIEKYDLGHQKYIQNTFVCEKPLSKNRCHLGGKKIF